MSLGRKIYPENGRVLFDGGLNNKFERSIIADNESPDCLNVVFENGSVATREGFGILNTASVGTFACHGLYTRHDQTTAQTMVAWYGGTCWTLAGTTFTSLPSSTSVYTAGTRVGAAEYQNHIYFGNGAGTPYKWNGTDFTRHGVYPPTTTASVATAGAGGNLNGLYYWKVTYVNSQAVESDVGPLIGPFTAANESVTMTSVPIAPTSYGVNSRNIYRTVTSGATYLRVGSIADNTTTTFNDNVADGSLGTTAPTDNGVPPAYSAIIYHAGRLFCNDPAEPGYVKYSEYEEPFTFASTNFRRAGDRSGDIVQGFGVYDNSVYAFCNNSVSIIYIVDPSDDTTWVDIKVNSAHGSKSPYAILDINDTQMFPAMQNDKFVGFAMIKGNSVQPSQTLLSVGAAGSFLESERVEPDMFTINESYVGRISGIVFKNKAWFSVPYGTSQETNNRVYVYDFSISNLTKNQKAAWVPFDGFTAEQFTIYGGNLYFGDSAATGYVYKAENGTYNDNGAAINSYYWTKEFGGQKGDLNYQKDFRFANLLVEQPGAWFMNLGFRVDSDVGTGNVVQIDLSPGGSLWGTMVFGRDSWGGGTAQKEQRVFLGQARGERIQFKFTNQNTADQWFKVHSMTFVYNSKGVR